MYSDVGRPFYYSCATLTTSNSTDFSCQVLFLKLLHQSIKWKYKETKLIHTLISYSGYKYQLFISIANVVKRVSKLNFALKDLLTTTVKIKMRIYGTIGPRYTIKIDN